MKSDDSGGVRGDDARSRDVSGPASSPGTTVDEADSPGVVPEEPIGTLFVMILFILLLVGLWGTVFWMLLNR